MQKLILFFLFIICSSYLQAQRLSVSRNYSTLEGGSHHEIAPSVELKNTENRPMEVSWEQLRTNVPKGWEVVVCDKQCYSTLIQKKTFTLAPNEYLSDFRVSFRPNGIDGVGTVEIKVYDSEYPYDAQTIVFIASAQNTAFSHKSTVYEDKPSIYPNPATEYIMVRDANSTVRFLEIYNVIGRKIKSFSVPHTGNKFDISYLPRGMYSIRMLDHNKNIIKTQRISKYNP